MPVMDGFTAAVVLKRTLPRVRVMLLTLYADTDLGRAAQEARIDALVVRTDAIPKLVETAWRLIEPGEQTGV